MNNEQIDNKDHDPAEDVRKLQSEVLARFHWLTLPRKPLGKPTGHSGHGPSVGGKAMQSAGFHHAAGFGGRKSGKAGRVSRKYPFGGAWGVGEK